jgi:NAD+ kinase
MHVLIYSQRFKTADREYVKTLLSTLKDQAIKVSFYKPYHELLIKKFPEYSEHSTISEDATLAKEEFDMVLSLGGDGTILNAVTLVKKAEIPICGINLGRLGFMATVEKTRIVEAIEKIKRGEFRVESRSMLQLQSNKDLFDGLNFALNDFTLHKRDTSSMMIIHTYINGDFINSYWADGLIVSTPTGSTGYTLSCGGPIVFPQSTNFVITPVAPHNLNVRPIMISDDSEILFKIEGRSKNYLCTLDSRSTKVTKKIELKVSRNDFDAKIALLDDISFIETIRKKLNWGLDSRN